MKFPDDSSGKRHHYQRFMRERKYIFPKKEVANEKSMEQMKHKPYSCDFKKEEKGSK